MKYAISTEIGAAILIGETPFPAGAAWPVPPELESLPEKYLKVVDGKLLEKTAEEKAQADADEAAKKAQEEVQRQYNKPLALKSAENRFLNLCDILTGGSSHTKLGFAVLQELILQIPDPNQQMYMAVQLLTVDAECKREGGLLWWDDCIWHDLG